MLSEREREESLVCALRLKQTWGFLNQASPLGGIRDPERDSKSPKGSELGSGFRPSHFPLGKSQWKCAFFFSLKASLCHWINAQLRRFASVPLGVLYLR